MSKTIEIEKGKGTDGVFLAMKTLLRHKADDKFNRSQYYVYFHEGNFVATDSRRLCKVNIKPDCLEGRFGFTEKEIKEFSGTFWDVLANTPKKIVLKFIDLNEQFPRYEAIFPEWKAGEYVPSDGEAIGHSWLISTIFQFTIINTSFLFDAIKDFKCYEKIGYVRTENVCSPIGFIIPDVFCLTEILIMPLQLRQSEVELEEEKKKKHFDHILTSIEKYRNEGKKNTSVA